MRKKDNIKLITDTNMKNTKIALLITTYNSPNFLDLVYRRLDNMLQLHF